MCTVLLPPGDNPIAGNKYILYQTHIMTCENRTKYTIGVLYESKTSLIKCFVIKLMQAFTRSLWSEYSPCILKYADNYLIRFCTALLVSEDQTSIVQMKQGTIIQ
jgi:hypothetical protein